MPEVAGWFTEFVVCLAVVGVTVLVGVMVVCGGASVCGLAAVVLPVSAVVTVTAVVDMLVEIGWSDCSAVPGERSVALRVPCDVAQ